MAAPAQCPTPPAARLYPETADIETSSAQYARRFSGPAGAWLLAVQERLALALILRDQPDTILDVGGGHGQLARPLAAAGRTVTVLGSEPGCSALIEDDLMAGRLAFETGNVIALPFADQAFDTAISFRLLTHCARWPELIAELTRVARRAVVLDYPARRSVNCLAGLLFAAKKKYEGDTRTFRPFSHGEVADAMRQAGFVPAGRRAQFFWPMVLHRALKRPRLSRALEAPPRLLGLTRLFGSPIIARFERQEPA
ncbi:MAG: class I SAM-dependent methyltransferase [Candidatus Marinimicrobia bacterium]|nr:class I SAM-dependent methyltransferase [Candidatus Neomarinimicrobiota bacterium]